MVIVVTKTRLALKLVFPPRGRWDLSDLDRIVEGGENRVQKQSSKNSCVDKRHAQDTPVPLIYPEICLTVSGLTALQSTNEICFLEIVPSLACEAATKSVANFSALLGGTIEHPACPRSELSQKYILPA